MKGLRRLGGIGAVVLGGIGLLGCGKANNEVETQKFTLEIPHEIPLRWDDASDLGIMIAKYGGHYGLIWNKQNIKEGIYFFEIDKEGDNFIVKRFPLFY